jgi:hypothetical protein
MMSEVYDVPELQLLAHGNISLQMDFATCMPTIPQDLLESVRFVYQHYSSLQARQQHGLVGTIVNYCISVFFQHKLGENVDFLKLAAEIPEFRQDLCRTNMERNFQDDCKSLSEYATEAVLTLIGAFDIIRLCLDNIKTQPGIHPTTLASRDLPREMISGNLPDAPSQPQHEPSADEDTTLREMQEILYDNMAENTSENMVDSVTAPLVHRPKTTPVAANTEGESSNDKPYIGGDSSDDESDFTVVSLPNPHGSVTPMILCPARSSSQRLSSTS